MPSSSGWWKKSHLETRMSDKKVVEVALLFEAEPIHQQQSKSHSTTRQSKPTHTGTANQARDNLFACFSLSTENDH
jgi:hypothetical protein